MLKLKMLNLMILSQRFVHRVISLIVLCECEVSVYWACHV